MKPKVNQPSQNRRKILQGTLAAPMVLTVSSASASSVTSFGKCLNRLANEQPRQFFVDASKSDNWLRKEVPVVKLQNRDVIDWFYFDPGINDYVRLSNPYLATGIGSLLTGSVQKKDADSGWQKKGEEKDQDSDWQKKDGDRGWQKKGEGKRWALVWVDTRSGTPFSVMQVQQPNGFQATSLSCMTSVKPGALL